MPQHVEEYRVVLLLARSQAFDLQRFFILTSRQILAKVNANFCRIRTNQSYTATNLVGMKKFYVSRHLIAPYYLSQTIIVS